MSGPAPFGMRRVNGVLVPELSERHILREVVEAFIASGGRIKATAGTLNMKGYKTRRGTAWTDTAVNRVLRNPALAEMIPGTLWHRYTGLLEERSGGGGRRSRRPIHPLGGVVHCRCGGRMRLRGNGPAGKYCCRSCGTKIAQDTLEKLFENSLSSVEIERCIERNIPLFEAGAQGEHKLLRGFEPSPTYSNHWIRDPDLARAIYGFLRQERRAIKARIRSLGEYGPYKCEDS